MKTKDKIIETKTQLADYIEKKRIRTQKKFIDEGGHWGLIKRNAVGFGKGIIQVGSNVNKNYSKVYGTRKGKSPKFKF